MRPFLLIALLALSACDDPMLATEFVVGANGVTINPTLSGTVEGATVSIQSN